MKFSDANCNSNTDSNWPRQLLNLQLLGFSENITRALAHDHRNENRHHNGKSTSAEWPHQASRPVLLVLLGPIARITRLRSRVPSPNRGVPLLEAHARVEPQSGVRVRIGDVRRAVRPVPAVLVEARGADGGQGDVHALRALLDGRAGQAGRPVGVDGAVAVGGQLEGVVEGGVELVVGEGVLHVRVVGVPGPGRVGQVQDQGRAVGRVAAEECGLLGQVLRHHRLDVWDLGEGDVPLRGGLLGVCFLLVSLLRSVESLINSFGGGATH